MKAAQSSRSRCGPHSQTQSCKAGSIGNRERGGGTGGGADGRETKLSTGSCESTMHKSICGAGTLERRMPLWPPDCKIVESKSEGDGRSGTPEERVGHVKGWGRKLENFFSKQFLQLGCL